MVSVKPEPKVKSTYCESCGHDLTRHRGNRCWTDCMGEPLFRTRSLIACDCDGLVAT